VVSSWNESTLNLVGGLFLLEPTPFNHDGWMSLHRRHEPRTDVDCILQDRVILIGSLCCLKVKQMTIFRNLENIPHLNYKEETEQRQHVTSWTWRHWGSQLVIFIYAQNPPWTLKPLALKPSSLAQSPMTNTYEAHNTMRILYLIGSAMFVHSVLIILICAINKVDPH
jgi:hypothetical protein